MDTSKIIIGTVGGGRYTVTAPIVKEDYGLYLKIEGLELPSTYEVDFSSSEHNGTSVTMIGNSDGVLIPNQFISSGKDVFAFLYHVGEDYGRTIFKFRIPNKLRPDRTNEQPTPEEQSVIDQAISALNNAIEATEQNVSASATNAQNALNSAFSASADADRAEQAKEDASTFAQRSANSAQASADYSASAQASATASANSASASAQIKADVEDLVDDAQGYAQASERSASASANSASQASASATSAIQASSNASDMALSAQTYSEIAQSHATQAGQSAQTASEKADSILNLTASAQTLSEGSSASASYNAQTGVMTFGIPKGADGRDGTDGKDGVDGNDGISPTVTTTPITGGHRITIIDKDGEHSADVMDGHNGMVTEYITGTTPTITAQADTRYVCGEVATLDFTPSASGICDVVFTSGATATVLTVPSTIKWANGFDPTSLEANTTYEINIMDGLGVACAWT